MRPTIAYEHLKLHRPRALSMSLDETLSATTLPLLYVSILRENLVRWTNDYKLLLEFAMEVFDKKDIGISDLIRFYNEEHSTRVYGLTLKEIRKLKTFYQSHTGDLGLKDLEGL